MSYEISREDLFAKCDILYDDSGELHWTFNQTIQRALSVYRSPFFNGPDGTGELVVIPHSLRFGAAVRYCEIDASPDMEPKLHYNFAPLFAIATDYWVERLGFDTEILTPPSMWWDNIIPGAMQAGYSSIGINRMIPSSHP
jgi:hypothetical protein